MLKVFPGYSESVAQAFAPLEPFTSASRPACIVKDIGGFNGAMIVVADGRVWAKGNGCLGVSALDAFPEFT